MIAVIPARAGSKRVPDKNFIDFFGKPVHEYPIEAARASGLFNDIVFATDRKSWDNKPGVTVYKRDPVDDNETLAEFLTEFLYSYPLEDKYICLLYACNPFVTPGLLQEAYRMMVDKDLSSVWVSCGGKPAGMFWFVNIERFIKDVDFFSGESIEVEPWMAWDIDTKADLLGAEMDYVKHFLGA